MDSEKTKTCAECGGTMRWTDADFHERYRGESILVRGVGRWECEDCGDALFDPKALDAIDATLRNEYARRHALLSPSEIRDVREGLGLSQTDFERLLGVKSPTASRWERGKVQQSATADGLIRAISESDDVLVTLARLRGVELPNAPLRERLLVTTSPETGKIPKTFVTYGRYAAAFA